MSDYDRIAQAITFITDRVKTQPTLDEIAAHLHLSPFHFQRLFCRWAGVTPKRFLQVLTVGRAKQLLSESSSLLEVSDALGLSSGSRLHDHFVQLDAVTPGEYKKRGAGLKIKYAVHETPFGNAFVATTSRGICKLAFLADSDIDTPLSELSREWPHATLYADVDSDGAIIEAIFARGKQPDKPLSLYVSGTNFQVSVWKALLDIPPGSVTSYTQIASRLDRPRAARAVGTAIGANPVGFLIPCHRVIRQSGRLGGYHWGETRKHAMHVWESAESRA